MKVQHGKKLQHLGMDLDYTTPGGVKISMVLYVNNILKDLTEKIVGPVATPAADLLFEVQDDANATKLPESKSITFHHNFVSCY